MKDRSEQTIEEKAAESKLRAKRAIIADKRKSVLWLENKVNAGESGAQLTNYSKFIARLPEPDRPKLVVLGPTNLGDGIRWVSWQKLWTTIQHDKTTNLYWRDFAVYLEELNMANAYDEPIQEGETKVLLDARRLLGKTARILGAFATEANGKPEWSSWARWPEENNILDMLVKHLKDHGTLAIPSSLRANLGIGAGIYHEVSTNDAWIGLWIYAAPKLATERRAILDLATELFGDEWSRDESEWQFVGAYCRLTELKSHQEATNWLMLRLGQLHHVGMLELLARL